MTFVDTDEVVGAQVGGSQGAAMGRVEREVERPAN